MSTKLVKSIREAIELAGLKDGMTVSFHHHLRNGDYVLNMVLEQIADLGIKELNVNASSVFDTHLPLVDHIQNHVVTGIQTNYMASGVGRAISAGVMEKPVQFRTHGGRPSDIALGRTPIDVAFIAAPPPTLWATAPVSTARVPAAVWAMPSPTPCMQRRSSSSLIIW